MTQSTLKPTCIDCLWVSWEITVHLTPFKNILLGAWISLTPLLASNEHIYVLIYTALLMIALMLRLADTRSDFHSLSVLQNNQKTLHTWSRQMLLTS